VLQFAIFNSAIA